MQAKFNHIGVPIDHITSEMIHHEAGKFWECDAKTNPFGIEYMYFDEEAPYPSEHKKIPHVCFEVEDMEPYLEYAERIILGPCRAGDYWALFFRMKDFPMNIELYCRQKPDMELVGME